MFLNFSQNWITLEANRIINCTTYGVKPDGKDCTQALQNAIYAAQGGTLLIPPGEYTINNSIHLGNTIIKGTGSNSNSPTLILDNASNVVVQGCVFENVLIRIIGTPTNINILNNIFRV